MMKVTITPPFEAIRRKERELAQQLKDAEKRANEKLARARASALLHGSQYGIVGDRRWASFLTY